MRAHHKAPLARKPRAPHNSAPQHEKHGRAPRGTSGAEATRTARQHPRKKLCEECLEANDNQHDAAGDLGAIA